MIEQVEVGRNMLGNAKLLWCYHRAKCEVIGELGSSILSDSVVENA